MDAKDEELRNAITDGLTRANVDARNLSIEVAAGEIAVTGTVPTEEEKGRLTAALAQHGERAKCDVEVRDMERRDSSDGRGRSPVTGTSADSRHESEHQRDRN